MEMEKMSPCGDHKSKDEEEDMQLPGFRFHPTDEELVGFYLRRKVEKKPISIELIKQIDIYKYDPWDLPIGTVGDKEWYFFCLRGRKYRNSIRPNRVTGSGFWKATGIDKPIYSAKDHPHLHHDHECIGLKKSLVYYRGSAGKGTKTDWMMHEFRLPPTAGVKNATNLFCPNKNIAQEAEVWTLCRIFKRIPSYKKYAPAGHWKEMAASCRGQNPTDSSSKTCSLESDNSEQPVSFGDSFVQENERKPVIHRQVDGRSSRLFMGQSNSSVTQAPFPATYPSFWNANEDDLFTNGNWDDLRTVVGLAIDPSHEPYDCR